MFLQLFDSLGLCFDASSGYEVFRALACGISAKKISLSSQEFPNNFYDIYSMGVAFNACSLSQLERFGEMFPGHECGIRFNPGQGSGGTTKTNVVSCVVYYCVFVYQISQSLLVYLLLYCIPSSLPSHPTSPRGGPPHPSAFGMSLSAQLK